MRDDTHPNGDQTEGRSDEQQKEHRDRLVRRVEHVDEPEEQSTIASHNGTT